jgi:hypothetical protein
MIKSNENRCEVRVHSLRSLEVRGGLQFQVWGFKFRV